MISNNTQQSSLLTFCNSLNTTSLKEVVFVLFGATAFRAYAKALDEIRNTGDT